MASLQPVRGTHDLLPEDYRAHHLIQKTCRKIAGYYGFEEIATPIFEFTNVFSRTLGETSDVVTKEMYCFEDKGGESITLRPEGTAAVARAFMSNGMAQNVPVKVFYKGPMFRYERPQKGRQRQFHQVGVELLGAPSPLADVDVLAMGMDFLSALGLRHKVKLQLNSLGNPESRAAYRDTLVDYLAAYRDQLSEDSRERLERNPMRILDSKDEGDQEIVANAPVIGESLDQASQDFFQRVIDGLETLGIPYNLNQRLVRGLDYYSHTAFEFTTEHLGAQGTVLGGGRYDGLIGQMGGAPTPGIGWAAGVERLAMLLDNPPQAPRPLIVVPTGSDVEDEAMSITYRLRQAGFVTEMGYSGNMGKRMKKANKMNARAALILGSDEMTRNVVTVRDLDSGDQEEVPLDLLEENLVRFKG